MASKWPCRAGDQKGLLLRKVTHVKSGGHCIKGLTRSIWNLPVNVNGSDDISKLVRPNGYNFIVSRN